MDDIVQVNFDNVNNDSGWSMCCYSAAEVKDLIYIVETSAKDVLQKLKTGMPKCIYQLNLYNDLVKKGLHLQAGKSPLNNCVKGEPAREIITVNDILVIECFVESDIIEHHKKRIKFDLENDRRAKGLLINFSEKLHGSLITIIDNTAVLH